MKRVLLINPPGTEQSGYSNPPLGLLYLAGTLLKNGFEVRVVDGCAEGEKAIETAIRDFRPGIAGITCLTPKRKKALEAARLVKSIDSGVLTVLGGAHPTIMYAQIMENYPFVDCVVLGEGEAALLEIAQEKPFSEIAGIVCRKDGGSLKTASRKYAENLDDIPFPAWHLVDIKKYPARGAGVFNGIDLAKEPRISVIFSRGCSGHCDFCSTWRIWRGWRRRSAANMVDEIELLYRDFGIRHFAFADDCLTIDRQETIGLCDEIIARKLNIAFFATSRTDCVDETVLRKLKDAGCYTISLGVETGSPRLLQKMGKESDLAVSERAILICRKLGLRVTVLLIIGNVGETWETVMDTVRFLRKTRPDEIASVGALWILPGTRLYQKCMERGMINDEFWLTDEPYMIYTAEHSLEELARMRSMIINYRPVWDRVRGRAAGFAARIRGVASNAGLSAAIRKIPAFLKRCVNRLAGMAAMSPHSGGKPANYREIVPDYSEYARLQRTTWCSHEIEVPQWEEGQKRYLLETFGPLDRALKVLDIACGDGVGLRVFRLLGFKDVVGVEFNGEKTNKARESGYPVYQFDMHSLESFRDNEFDIVYSSHTLEHAYWPDKALAEFRRVLKPGGKLYVVLPYPDAGEANNEAHGGKFELGTNVIDDGRKVVEYIIDKKFSLIAKKYDSYREPEIWLEFVKKV